MKIEDKFNYFDLLLKNSWVVVIEQKEYKGLNSSNTITRIRILIKEYK